MFYKLIYYNYRTPAIYLCLLRYLLCLHLYYYILNIAVTVHYNHIFIFVVILCEYELFKIKYKVHLLFVLVVILYLYFVYDRVLQNFLKSDQTIDRNDERAELKLVGFLAEHNISSLNINHLKGALKDCFPDIA